MSTSSLCTVTARYFAGSSSAPKVSGDRSPERIASRIACIVVLLWSSDVRLTVRRHRILVVAPTDPKPTLRGGPYWASSEIWADVAGSTSSTRMPPASLGWMKLTRLFAVPRRGASYSRRIPVSYTHLRAHETD